MLTKRQHTIKRFFDLFFSFFGIILLTIPIFILSLFAAVSTKKSGVFKQLRIGQNGKPFTIYKIRSMMASIGEDYITTKNDKRITKFGGFLRKYHLDELPQLYNVFFGTMSLVGPRPDVKGYADELKDDDRVILSVKPGITGPATLKFRNETVLLSKQDNPKKYNDDVLWKQKIILNKNYIKNWSLTSDIKYIFKTLF